MSALTCPDCNQTYRATAGHCRGGRFGGCCKSWGTQRAHERHRIGNYDDGSRRCMTTEEMVEAGWAERDGRWYHPTAVKDWERGHRMALPGLRASEGHAGKVEVAS
jgi:hypothetical protein